MTDTSQVLDHHKTLKLCSAQYIGPRQCAKTIAGHGRRLSRPSERAAWKDC